MRNEPQHNHLENCFVGVRKLTRNLREATQQIYIAYSGGIDSHVLLHLCAADEQHKTKMTAVYINHGLQKEAEDWGKHCESVCENLGVRFLSMTVNAKAAPGQSPEEAARDARYAALKTLLAEGDVLLLAQHREDQLETVLLQLFRGSGLNGLSGIPESTAFGEGVLLRPLLGVSKVEIQDYATQHGLKWVEDPSNQQSDFDRNFLRNDIIPLLKQRWPALDKTVSRSARHCANAEALLTPLAESLFDESFDKKAAVLRLDVLQSYTELQQHLVVRQWFKRLGLKMPSQDLVQSILGQIVSAREDAEPVLSTQGHTIRRYRNALYCLKADRQKSFKTLSWPSHEFELNISDGMVYQVESASTGILADKWCHAVITVKPRSGGEAVKLPGRVGRHALKKLFQEAGIPPWERAAIPLIYLDGKLAAVGEHWISDEFYAEGQCLRIVRK